MGWAEQGLHSQGVEYRALDRQVFLCLTPNLNINLFTFHSQSTNCEHLQVNLKSLLTPKCRKPGNMCRLLIKLSKHIYDSVTGGHR